MTTWAGAFWAAIVTWAAIPIGALGLLAANHLMGGKWGPMAARALIPAVRTLPWTVLPFLPFLVFPDLVWPWAAPDWQAHGPGKEAWFAPSLFAARTIFYFAAWSVLARWLLGRRELGTWPRRLPAAIVTLAAWFLTGSLAAVDWVLSLDPDFNSSIFGLLFLSHATVGALAFITAATMMSGETGTATGKLGALLLAALIAWVYFSYMQYLVIWTGDLPHQAAWYLRRGTGGWGVVAWVVIALHGAFPILALMWRAVRLNARRLAAAALAVLLAVLLDGAWLVAPQFDAGPFHLLAAFVVVGAAWLGLFAFFRARQPRHPAA